MQTSILHNAGCIINYAIIGQISSRYVLTLLGKYRWYNDLAAILFVYPCKFVWPANRAVRARVPACTRNSLTEFIRSAIF